MRKKGIYIHIPFCVKKCSYCAFLSFDAGTSARTEYAGALMNEIRLRGERLGHPEIYSVYVGGGTPSLLDISQMRGITDAVNKYFRVKEDAELTIEANPATLGRRDDDAMAKLQSYRSMGFNRLSMGAQSMDNDRLHYLGRIHTAEDVRRDVELARRAGFDNINLDLIFSVPGSSTTDTLNDLEKILGLGPEHISCYSLQIEEGTPFGRMAEAGELTEVPDEEDRMTYHEICRILKDTGYEHYEISNFARRDQNRPDAPSPFRSKHNSLYWNMSDYIGVGLGASGFADGTRYRNISDMDEYICAFAEYSPELEIPLGEKHVNTAFDNISEAVFTGLRRIEGVTYEEAVEAGRRAGGGSFSGDAKEEFWNTFGEAKEEAELYTDRGLLVMGDNGLRLTEQGIDISNSIMALFV